MRSYPTMIKRQIEFHENDTSAQFQRTINSSNLARMADWSARITPLGAATSGVAGAESGK